MIPPLPRSLSRPRLWQGRREAEATRAAELATAERLWRRRSPPTILHPHPPRGGHERAG